MKYYVILVMGTGILWHCSTLRAQETSLEKPMLVPAPGVPAHVRESDYVAAVAAENVEQLEERLSKNDFPNMVVLGTTDDTAVLEVLRNRRFRRLFQIYGRMSPEESARRSVDLANARLDAVLAYCSNVKQAFETNGKVNMYGFGAESCNIHEAANASVFLVAKYSPKDLSSLEERLLIGHRDAEAASREARNNGRNQDTIYFDDLVYSNTVWASVYSFALGQSIAKEEFPDLGGLEPSEGMLVRWDAPNISHSVHPGLRADVMMESSIVARFQMIQVPSFDGAGDQFRFVIDTLRRKVASRFPSTPE